MSFVWMLDAQGTMIDNALNGKLIDGTEMRSSRSSKPSMLYTAAL